MHKEGKILGGSIFGFKSKDDFVEFVGRHGTYQALRHMDLFGP
jgi:hypothetical protein